MDQSFADLRFRFVSHALPRETFSVVSFEGREALSELYAFTVDLASREKDLDVDAIMDAQAGLTLSMAPGSPGASGAAGPAGPAGDVTRSGVLESFAELHEAGGLYFYRAVLRPRLWRLTLAQANQVFVNQDVKTILQRVLEEGGLSPEAFSFRLQGDPPRRDFVCQYGESLYDFFDRWLRRYGMYYYFEHDSSGETLVITDTKIAHDLAEGAEELVYARTSGLEASHFARTVHDFSLRRTLTPSAVTLKDYDYRKPNLDLTVKESLSIKGAGETYFYGDHYRTPDEGKKLAKIRGEAFAAEALTASGASFVPALRPGFLFNLTRHFNSSLNGRYLAVSVGHKGYAAMAGTAGFGETVQGERRLHYENVFTAIKAGAQYRPPRKRRAAIAGVMDAKVDAAGSGRYAELDDQGRYKVRLFFDQQGLAPGKASHAVRMMQPYGGSGFGLHCPLHKDAEIALGYVDGDPDRPVILAAAPNPGAKSPVNNETQTQCRLTTAGGNKLHFEDKEASQRILLSSKTGDYMRIGAHNDPATLGSLEDYAKEYFSEDGIVLYAPENHWIDISCKNEFLTVFGETVLLNLGWYSEMVVLAVEISFNLTLSIYLAYLLEAESFHEALEAVRMRIHPERTVLHGTNQQMTVADVRAGQAVTDTALSHQETIGEQLRVSQNRLQTSGQRSQATGQVFDASQTANELSGQNTAAYQDHVRTCQEQQHLAGQRNVMAQEDIQTAVDKTAALTQGTSTCQERMLVCSNKVDAMADFMAMCSLYSRE